MNHAALTKPLGYAGLLPFLVPLYLMVQGFSSDAGLQSASLLGLYAPYVFIAYSAVILSFLSGTLWTYARPHSGILAAGAILFSNLVALAAWLSLLLIYLTPIMTLFALCLLMAAYLGLLLIERLLNVPQESGYWRMRVQLTILVAAAHLAVIFMTVAEL